MENIFGSRSFLLACHVFFGWLFLLPTLYMFVTGIASALSDQMERIIEPELFSVQPLPEEALPVSVIEQAVRRQINSQVFNLIPRTGVFDTWQVTYTSTEERIMWLNPYTAEVLGDRAASTRPKAIINGLHTGEWFGWPAMATLFAFAFISVALVGLGYSKAYKRGKDFGTYSLALYLCQ